jgi:hypothetical protein
MLLFRQCFYRMHDPFPAGRILLSFALFSLVESSSTRAATVINFEQCVESIGIQPVARTAVLPLLPSDFSTRFGFGGFGAAPAPDQAQLITRTMHCAVANAGATQLGPLTTSQYGVITARTDAQQLAGSAFNGIDNWQLATTTSSSPLASLLNDAGVVTSTAPGLSYSQDSLGAFATTNSPLFTTTGRHDPPSMVFPGGFIAHWWSDGPNGEQRSRQVIPSIVFRFSGAMTLTPSPGTSLATILSTNPVPIQVPLGGEFLSGPVEIAAVPGPLPWFAAPLAMVWSRRLRGFSRRRTRLTMHASNIQAPAYLPRCPSEASPRL